MTTPHATSRRDAPWPGLSPAEAAARLAAEGYNELPAPDRRTPLRIVVEVVREPMFALLLAGGVVYLALGDLQEALMLLGFASLSVAITVVQESRSERVLDALRDLSSPRALVIRDGTPTRIPGREVARGDLVVLAEGDRVPADAILLSGQDLRVDESLLTGESVPVRKTAGALDTATPRPGGDDLPHVFSGTLVVGGRGVAAVQRTGPGTELGRIGHSLGAIAVEPTRLSVQTRMLVRVVALAGGGVSVAVVLLYGLVRGAWLDGLLGGIALSMALLPEEFPLVLAVFMVTGAWRISRARVLTRRAATIETLGAATVLCTDKTGTLTQNRMAVAELRAGDAALRPDPARVAAPTEPFRALVAAAVLASAAPPTDPMDAALHALEGQFADHADAARRGWTLARVYGLRPELPAIAQVWATADPTSRVVAAKGAPEAVAALCRLDAAATAAMGRAVDQMAAGGMRVLAAARAQCDGGDLPDTPRGFDFRFLGLIGFSDPLRPGVADAVRECQSAGIRVVMITGDYPATAQAIAAQAGIAAGDLVTGRALEKLSDDAVRARVRTAAVFARIMPEQKLRIVTALKASGEIVAMTGDGVNDAPSLKAAHIGVAMGGRGTDVAREAASIVLLDDDFGSLVRTVRLGRRIYDNLRKAFGYILAIHVPIAGLSLMPLVLGWPVILGPIHIAFIEMVIDPVCSIVFEAEPEEDDVMRRPPRDPAAPLFSKVLAGWGVLQGLLALLVVAGVFALGVQRGMPDDELRALVFASLVFINIGLILVNRTFSASLLSAFRGSSTVLWTVTGVAGALLALAVTWPPAEALFRFGPLHLDDLAVAAAGGLGVLIILELIKPALGRRAWR
ncbi:MAG: cation-translocating P-type ATPase [Proteobacteria bacterium]|nr:cation-translocating P-type ATPase [Pseudomonadota bacterium]